MAEQQDVVINGVSFFWVKMKEPTYKFKDKVMMEYSVDAVISKEESKKWKKTFPKNPVREVDTCDFEEAFKAPAPFPDQDEQYVVKLRRNFNYRTKDGEVVNVPDQYRPKVLLKNEDGTLRDVTRTTLIGNGSKGVIQVGFKSTADYGTFADIKAIRVDELVGYEGGSGGGETLLGDVVDVEMPTEVTQTQGATQTQQDSVSFDDYDSENIPF